MTAKEVMAFFLRNPQAADVEDVARWRLQQDTIDHTVAEVSAALAWLERKGFLLKEEAPGIKPMFKLNPQAVAEAKRFVADASAADAARGVRALVQRALAWVDGALLRYHRENPPLGDELPGLTRSRASIESALLPRLRSAGAAGDEGRTSAAESARQLVTAFKDAGRGEPLAALYNGLRLQPLELQALLLCLAPELDSKYQAIYGVLNDDLGRRAATLGLIGAVLGEGGGIRQALTTTGGLTRWRLLQTGASLPYADEPVRLDPSLLSWLLGDVEALPADPRLSAVLSRRPRASTAWTGRREDVDALGGFLADGAETDWLVLAGEDVEGWSIRLEWAAREVSRPLLRVSLPAVSALDPVEAEEIATRLVRAARLTPATPVLDGGERKGETAGPEALGRFLDVMAQGSCGVVVLVPEVERIIGATPRRRTRVLHRPAPGHEVVAEAFRAAAADAGIELPAPDADRLAQAFPLPLGRIEDAVRLAALGGSPAAPKARPVDSLAGACRRIASPDLPRFARRVDPTFELTDVILPDDRHAQLTEIVGHVRHASLVLNTWGFKAQLPYGRGVAALFCGPSGTGKTMAAHAIARELRTDTYVVDLSKVVSKYIGESEKNLDCVFDDAERAGAVLLFDEADALFGKRSEIKDAHDRYANIEVAYLLQRIEAFSGLAVLTTNFRQNLDQAFVRRLRFVVDFPRPDAVAREAIWRQCLPEDAPREGDLRLRTLARRLDLTGGNIRQITLRAAFLAAADGATALRMAHVLEATRAELLKLGMVGAERELAALEGERPVALPVA